MAIVSVIGSKGGVGTSLVATNLGSALATNASTLLVDLNVGTGVDDLLLDLSAGKSWANLLAVLDELQPRHIEFATIDHSSGLKLLPGPAQAVPVENLDRLSGLIKALSGHFDWCLVDLAPGLSATNQELFSIADAILLVTSADPPALRSSKRFLAGLSPETIDRVALVINQINRQHPSTAGQIAGSLDLPLLISLPPDPGAIGYQVHFGWACVLDPSSAFGRGVRSLAARLQKSAGNLTSVADPRRQGE